MFKKLCLQGRPLLGQEATCEVAGKDCQRKGFYQLTVSQNSCLTLSTNTLDGGNFLLIK